MFCLPKACHNEKSALKDLSATVMLLGGILGIIYFGWRLFEKIRPLCEKKRCCTCCCDDVSDHGGYDHFSEGDCLSHDAKDYYGRCGCFDDDGSCTDGEDGTSDL